jgi:hypothetical protein
MNAIGIGYFVKPGTIGSIGVLVELLQNMLSMSIITNNMKVKMFLPVHESGVTCLWCHLAA